jgi:hypothetical protein
MKNTPVLPISVEFASAKKIFSVRFALVRAGDTVMSAWKKVVIRTTKPLSLGLFILLIISQISSRAQNGASVLTPVGVHPKGLSDSTRRVVFDRQAFSGESVPWPRWENGYLISHQIESYKAGTVNVRLYNISGAKVREAAVWFPGSQRVLIYSAIPTLDGRIIAAGAANKADGSVGPFITLINGKGNVTEVIQTDGFAPRNVCQAPDGTIWSFGSTGYDKSEPRVGDTLRHFDIQKGQVGSYLPRSSFAKQPPPDSRAFIRCSAHGVHVYSTKAAEYIEINYSGGTPHVYTAHSPSDFRLLGFVVTGPKRVYGYLYRPGEGGQSGVYYLSFDEAENTVTWLPVQGTVGPRTRPGVITGLWGADGDQLLVSRAEDSAGEVALHWVTPLE